jgi:PleD family two-component response regulator
MTSITVSIGITDISSERTTNTALDKLITDAVQEADLALYKAKETRNQVISFRSIKIEG